ncbi:hypothetical protein F0L68_33250 [Solihabitans fulvus]|uniref:Uncharacterized protein n=1 Tax=Solihabitans fulvus TaxID=1892852 RepID=A0A5B2WMM1_9PSEU|nr:hypothetical protein [Solihabitans fulvus]KAA2253283.1 hypothetical protein F0L68_33250 [Solihabitans fulvus]
MLAKRAEQVVAAHGRYAEGAAAADRSDIRTAVGFLGWPESIATPLGQLTQQQLDSGLHDNPTQRRDVIRFLRWVIARRIMAKLDIPTEKSRLPVTFQTEAEHRQQMPSEGGGDGRFSTREWLPDTVAVCWLLGCERTSVPSADEAGMLATWPQGVAYRWSCRPAGCR